MIYKFIDDNDSEITVNSLSSLQSLVDSETIKEDTKVKAGLRGKWTSASKIKELVFPKDEIQETEEPKEDIKSFITKEKPKEEVIETPKEEVIETPKEEVITNEQQNESSVDTSDYYTGVFIKKDNNEEEADKDEMEEEDVEEAEVFEAIWKAGGAIGEEPMPYLKTVLCRVVSIAAVVRKRKDDNSITLSLTSLPHHPENVEDREEAKLLSTFLNAIDDKKP